MTGAQSTLSRRILLHGSDAPLPVRTYLRAGPLTLFYENGDLRAVRLGERELLRRIYVAVRDQHWNTIPARLLNLQMDVGADGFRITYDAEHKNDDVDFLWRATINGDASGTVTFAMDGQARATFLKNRIGFCVLHPASVAGSLASVEHADGSIEAATFPEYISAEQPAPPFADLSAITQTLGPGLAYEVRFTGDIFEMEDQRNWTDASFKTFSTPLRLPVPVEIKAGARITQTICLQIKGDRGHPQLQRPQRKVSRQEVIQLRLDASAQTTRVPEIGLGVASHGTQPGAYALERLRALNLGHLRADLDLGTHDFPVVLERATQEARSLDLPLHLALRLPSYPDPTLQELKSHLERLNPRVALWLVFPEKELFWGGSAVKPAVETALRHLKSRYPEARFGSGTNADLIFLQRSLPPLEMLDVVAFSINPQVHASDGLSLVETLETQAVALLSARRLAGATPVFISPITLKPRFNAYAGGPEPAIPPDQLPPQVDPRQMSLFGAGWTLGSLKYLAEAGIGSVTYYETTGWRGVVETESGSPLPDQFPSLPNHVFPMYHVFADVADLAGAEVSRVSSSEPLKVVALALAQGRSHRLLIANLTPDPVQAAITGFTGPGRLRCLDERNVEEAMQDPQSWRAADTEQLPVSRSGFELKLLPFGLARIDFA